MSDDPSMPGPEALPDVAPAAAVACPIPLPSISPNLRKHVDPAAPVPLRMMAAKAVLPLAPPDMLTSLFMLAFDPEPTVRAAAAKSASGLPDRILGTALRDEKLPPWVLAYFLDLLWDRDAYAEMLVLNSATPDEAVAALALRASPHLVETISQNQLRLLRNEDIIRQLCANPQAQAVVLDSVCDFAVRSGIALQDVPQMNDARVRLFGPNALLHPPDPGPSAAEVLHDYKELAEEAAPPMEEGRRLNLTQRIMKMNIAQKIKLATLGNKEARGLLIRDSNKLVAVAVIRSPRLTDGEVLTAANSRQLHDEVMRVIYTDREWTKNYTIRMALVKNPKVPQAAGLKFLATLRETELKTLSRDKNVPTAISSMAKKMLDKKNTPKGDGH